MSYSLTITPTKRANVTHVDLRWTTPWGGGLADNYAAECAHIRKRELSSNSNEKVAFVVPLQLRAFSEQIRNLSSSGLQPHECANRRFFISCYMRVSTTTVDEYFT
jgi:hypothetical protein